MARMFPERPAAFDSPAERRLYEACRSLPDEYLVIAGLPIVTPQYESDADMLIAHPEWGFLVVEVKGGEIEYEAATGRWYSKDRRGVRHPLSRDPFEQAKGNAHQLERRLKEMPITKGYRYPFGWAVAFPDVVVPGDLGVIPREVILDHEDMAQLEGALARVRSTTIHRAWAPRTSPPHAIDALARALGQSILVRRPLRLDVQQTQWQLAQLTEQQYRVLRQLYHRRQALVRGCAGSGKTFLAMRKARTLYQQGLRVLLTCFNRPLADWMARYLEAEFADAGEGPPDRSRMWILNFHSLCCALAPRYGVALPEEGTKPHDTRWAEALSSVAQQSGPLFDAIVVDEAQDFPGEWWIPLQDLGVPDPFFYVFYDDNQRIYTPHRDDWPFDGREALCLTENVRFTRRIHDVVVPFYEGEPQPESARDVEGEPPVFHFGGGVREDMGLLRRVLHRVLVEGQVDARDVVILSPASARHSVLKEGLELGNSVLTWDPEKARAGAPLVLVSTIHRFKGLERPVVILAELEAMEHYSDQRRDMLLYVGVSRASAMLVVLGGCREWFRPGAGRVVESFDEQLALEQEVARAASEEEPVPALVSGPAPSRSELLAETQAATATEQEEAPRPASVPPEHAPAEPAREVEAVFIPCEPGSLEGNAAVAEAVAGGRAFVSHAPAGIVVQAWHTPVPRGSLAIVERLRPLPFSRSAWLVRVRAG